MDRNSFPHLTEELFAALPRLQLALGESGLMHWMSMDPNDQIKSVRQFVVNERRAAQTSYLQGVATSELSSRMQGIEEHLSAMSTRMSTGRPSNIKLDVPRYRGTEKENLLQWLVQCEAAMRASGIENEEFKITYALSHMEGRAREWTLNKMMADNHYFDTFAGLANELKMVFQPPKSEFRARVQFLSMKQGKMDLLTYVQQLRSYASLIVNDRIDETTQVSIFLQGLKEGPVRNELFRRYPKTFDEAITLALQEDFSLKQAKGGYFTPRYHTEPGSDMDCSVADAQTQCHNCRGYGHFSRSCPSPQLTRSFGNGQRGRGNGRGGRSGHRGRGGRNANRGGRYFSAANMIAAGDVANQGSPALPNSSQ